MTRTGRIGLSRFPNLATAASPTTTAPPSAATNTSNNGILSGRIDGRFPAHRSFLRNSSNNGLSHPRQHLKLRLPLRPNLRSTLPQRLSRLLPRPLIPDLHPQPGMRILLQKPPARIHQPHVRDDARGNTRLLHLFGTRIEVLAFVGVDHLAEADVAGVGVDAAAAAGEDVVGVGDADGGVVSWWDLGAGWYVVMGDVGIVDGGGGGVDAAGHGGGGRGGGRGEWSAHGGKAFVVDFCCRGRCF
mmetsp:Transcript_2723/g.5054  ORF Transcript_2723/g.5054 Transcript_2723/m.5054 type:complete len:244 (+) Transcript_2723:1001-1732(+)